MKEKKHLIIFIALLVFLISQAVYLFTLSPTVNFIDSGELITVCHKLGVAHPTGYPLYTLIGRLFSFIPLRNGALPINYMSSLFASLCGVAVFGSVLTILLILKKKSGVRIEELLPAGAAGLLACFSLTLWQQAVMTEVYALTAFIIAALIFIAVTLYRALRNENKSDILLFLFSFILGIGFGNHMSLIHVVPAAALFFFLLKKLNLRNLVPCFILFIVGLSIYFYLPVRSSLDPVMDWGNPDNPQRFFNHISGKQYRVWMFSVSGAVLKEHFVNYLSLTVRQFSPYLIPFSIIGFFNLLIKREFRILIFLLIIFFSDVAYSINYDIPDIDAYFIPSFLVLSVFSGIGLYAVPGIRLIYRYKRLKSSLKYAFLLLPLIPLTINWKHADNSSNYLGEIVARDVLQDVGPDALVLLKIWDYYSPARYFQEVMNLRRDVTLVDQMLLMRSWYIKDILGRYEILNSSQKEAELFLQNVKPFEEGESYNGNVIQSYFDNMINSFINKNIDERQVYLSNDEDVQIGKNYYKVPGKVLFRISEKDTISETNEEYGNIFDDNVYMDERTGTIINRYPLLLLKRAMIYQRKQMFDKAVTAYRKALRFDEDNVNVMFQYANCLAQMGNYEEALKITGIMEDKVKDNPRILMLKKLIEDRMRINVEK